MIGITRSLLDHGRASPGGAPAPRRPAARTSQWVADGVRRGSPVRRRQMMSHRSIIPPDALPRRAPMSSNGQTEARKIRDRLKHPVIDADGHWAEFAPHMREEFRRIGGDTAVEARAMASARIPNSLNMSVAERRRRRIGQEAFWFLPTKNTLDRATAMMPRP